MIYFIQAETGGPIKIGFAFDPTAGVQQVQCGNPEVVRILKTIPGGRKMEKEIHRQLWASHKRGEWFHDTPEVQAFIAQAGAFQVETLDGRAYLVLRRKTESSGTEPCPFCSRPHIHGIGDGHRVAHCVNPTVTEFQIGNVTVYQDHGYVIRTGDYSWPQPSKLL